MKKAETTKHQKGRFYTRRGDYIQCSLCPRGCRLKEGGLGICGVRQARGGDLYTLNYGLCASVAMDPIEKKPLYHFYPGSEILSIGTWGCNFQCSFCQNWSLAGGNIPEKDDAVFLQPEDILSLLKKRYGCSSGIAYTYNEPTVWFEFVYDTASLINKHGYKNILVTNGFISREALSELTPFIDALNIDVKSFNDDFYRRYCGGNLESVKQTVEYCVQHFHVEVTCLVIPSLNDSPEETEALTDWLSGLSPDIPLHFSRYFPQHKLSLFPTPVETLGQIRMQALQKMNYVYIGNTGDQNNTYCPHCRKLLIQRNGYRTFVTGLEGVKCAECHTEIYLKS